LRDSALGRKGQKGIFPRVYKGGRFGKSEGEKLFVIRENENIPIGLDYSSELYASSFIGSLKI
tara:strand:- start:190 stop:378 length:189 start_codon:yes stop_codon:yes gene_type:complete